jgi:hypothetical protein
MTASGMYITYLSNATAGYGLLQFYLNDGGSLMMLICPSKCFMFETICIAVSSRSASGRCPGAVRCAAPPSILANHHFSQLSRTPDSLAQPGALRERFDSSMPVTPRYAVCLACTKCTRDVSACWLTRLDNVAERYHRSPSAL